MITNIEDDVKNRKWIEHKNVTILSAIFVDKIQTVSLTKLKRFKSRVGTNG